MNEYEKLIDEAQEAIDAGDQKKADALIAKAEEVKARIEAQERVTALKTDAAARAAAAIKAKKDAEEAEFQRRVDEAVEEATKKLGVVRPPYSAGEDDDDPTIKMRGPYDDIDPHQLMLGYMVMKSWHPLVGSGPSLDYRRAVHGRAQDHVKRNGLSPVGYHDKNSSAVKALKGYQKPIFYHVKADNEIRKALAVKADELMGSDVSTAGDEWIPQMYSRELFRLIRNEARVASVFRQVEVAGESLTFPLQTGGATWYLTPQTDDAAELVYSNSFVTSRISQVATSSMTLTPAKISAIIIWTGELNEESLVPMLPFLQQELVTSGMHTIDELLISGDETTGATNISDYANGAISAYWRLLALDGLRHTALVDTAANSRDAGALTADDFIQTKRLMGTNGRNAINPNDVVWIMDNDLYYKMLSLGEVITRDKFGTAATIVDGNLERIYGSMVIPSDDYGLTDTSGYIHNTTSGNTKGSFLCVRPDQGVIGFGRRMMVETSRIARSDAYEIVGHIRLDHNMATDEAVALSYNVTVS